MATGSIVLVQDEVSAVRSLTSFASTCCWSTPPPQEWNRSGGEPAWVTVVSLDLNASFSSGVILMVTLVWAAMYALASESHIVSIGSVLAMCHQLIVTGP